MLALYRSWQRGEQLVSLARVLDDNNISWQRGWLVRLHDSLKGQGFLDGPANRRVEEMTAGSLTSSGLQFVEDHILPEEIEGDDKSEEFTESSVWTGLPEGFSLTEEKRSEIIRQLDLAESSIPNTDASQHNQAQARSYIVAARALLEAPDPEPELAWELIGRANNLAGIMSLFVSLIALFK